MFAVRSVCLPAKSLELWHYRLGYIKKELVKALQELATNIRVTIPEDSAELSKLCVACVHNKQIKKLLKD